MSRQLIAGNWKMNGLTADAQSLAQALQAGSGSGFEHVDLLVCPPFTQIGTVAAILGGSAIAVGGQDCHMQEKGAHTGDISAPMLRDLGASHVILGHSERRQNHKELDETVREKVLAARAAGLVPIVCVGETEDQRAADGYEDVVGWQIKGSLPDGFADGESVVAYEPVWAIGTGRTATEQDVATMHAFIRAELVRQFGDAGHRTRILYGGSVNAKNAAALLAVADVGGALVGGASLDAQNFLAIAAAASRG
ncbi:MAG: triose-phosphate isomerase [Janthinobacterium lividum]